MPGFVRTAGVIRPASPTRSTRRALVTVLALVVALLLPPRVAGLIAPAQASAATSDYGTGHEMAADPNGGYWLSNTSGGIFAFADAQIFGSMSGHPLNRPVVSMAATPDGGGYWMVASDGGIFAFGDAHFYGSTGSIHLNQPIVGMAPTADGHGYWLVASDGGIFAFGDAHFYGSTGSIHLNQPIVGMAPTADGHGYWLVASDGGIFAFGDARFYGSTGSTHLNQPVVAMAATPDSAGYWLVASDGGVFTFGDAPFYGSLAGTGASIDGIEVTPDNGGYDIIETNGSALDFTPSSPPTTPSGEMSSPAGYNSSEKILDDDFSGTRLDTSVWNTYIGANGNVWDDLGQFPSPYSGPNTPSSTNAEFYSPSQVSVDNGLTLTAQRSSAESGLGLSWVSGVVSTEGKFSLPAGGWYVQVKAEMPDSSQGLWPAIWFMPDSSSSSVPEIDLFEGGWAGSDPDSLMHTDYGGGVSEYDDYRDTVYNTGTDLDDGYNVYGIQFTPGVGVNYYFNGQLMFQQLAADPGGVVSDLNSGGSGTYEIILELQMATQGDSGWHTVPTSTSPGGSMKIAEVQAYSAP